MQQIEKDYPNEKKPKSHKIRLLLLVLIAVLLVVFSIQNSHEVVIKLWFWRLQTSMVIAIVISIISGIILTSLYLWPIISYKNKIIKAKDKELLNLLERKSKF